MKNIHQDNIIVTKQFNQVIVTNSSGIKLILDNPELLDKSTEEIKQYCTKNKVFNTREKGVRRV